MRTHRAGFTLVELLVVMVVGALLMGAAYEALIVQNRSYRATGAMIQGQDALRIALGVLETELRETASIGGLDIGGSDILLATPDSVKIRAPRKLGFVCSVSPSEKSMIVWVEGEFFEASDGLLIYVDNDITTYTDDRWDDALVQSVSGNTTTCLTSPTGSADQKIVMVAHPLVGVSPGAPLRAYEELTYGLFDFGGGDWGLGRRNSDGTLDLLVDGLAGSGQGLTFEYFDVNGNSTLLPTDIQYMEISVQTDPHQGSGTSPMTLTSTIYLRNN